MPRPAHFSLLMLAMLILGSGEDAGLQRSSPPYEPTEQYEQREVEGWTIHVSGELLEKEPELADRALKLLRTKLYDIASAVPEPALSKLREVPIWLGLRDRHDRFPCACYHPSPRWLEAHDYNPDKARSVDILNARNFIRWSRAQPWMVLHELAHAYHHRVLGHGHEALREAYQHARESGRYESVLHIDGRERRAYALNNDQEYFAEATEAYFGTNDFYPFVRAELKQHDPRLYELLGELWNLSEEED